MRKITVLLHRTTPSELQRHRKSSRRSDSFRSLPARLRQCHCLCGCATSRAEAPPSFRINTFPQLFLTSTNFSFRFTAWQPKHLHYRGRSFLVHSFINAYFDATNSSLSVVPGQEAQPSSWPPFFFFPEIPSDSPGWHIKIRLLYERIL